MMWSRSDPFTVLYLESAVLLLAQQFTNKPINLKRRDEQFSSDAVGVYFVQFDQIVEFRLPYPTDKFFGLIRWVPEP